LSNLITIILCTFHVLSNYQKARDETGKTSPWTCIGKFKLDVENELKTVEG